MEKHHAGLKRTVHRHMDSSSLTCKAKYIPTHKIIVFKPDYHQQYFLRKTKEFLLLYNSWINILQKKQISVGMQQVCHFLYLCKFRSEIYNLLHVIIVQIIRMIWKMKSISGLSSCSSIKNLCSVTGTCAVTNTTLSFSLSIYLSDLPKIKYLDYLYCKFIRHLNTWPRYNVMS